MCVRVQMHVCACVCRLCMCADACVCACVQMHVCVCACEGVCVCACVYVRVQMHVCRAQRLTLGFISQTLSTHCSLPICLSVSPCLSLPFFFFLSDMELIN